MCTLCFQPLSQMQQTSGDSADACADWCPCGPGCSVQRETLTSSMHSKALLQSCFQQGVAAPTCCNSFPLRGAFDVGHRHPVCWLPPHRSVCRTCADSCIPQTWLCYLCVRVCACSQAGRQAKRTSRSTTCVRRPPSATQTRSPTSKRTCGSAAHGWGRRALSRSCPSRQSPAHR